MKFKFLKVALSCSFLSVCGLAQAGLIIDTGSNINGPLVVLQNTPDFSQYFAGQFTTTQDWELNSIEAFVSNENSTAGTIEYGIWTGDGYHPTQLVFSAVGNIGGNASADWYGAFGLSEVLTTGTYWVSAIPSAEVIGIHYGNAPNPLVEYHQAENDGGGWQDGSLTVEDLNVGFRIDASSVDVPEPSTLAIFALGFMGLVSRRFKKKY